MKQAGGEERSRTLHSAVFNSPSTDVYCSISPKSEGEVSLPMRWGNFGEVLGVASLTPGRKPDLGAKAQQLSLEFLPTLADF